MSNFMRVGLGGIGAHLLGNRGAASALYLQIKGHI